MTTTRKSFNDAYAFGRIAEGCIARWLMGQGWIILPAYEIEIPSGKGPRLFVLDAELIAPDIFAMKRVKKKFICQWDEAKHKTRFTWYRKSEKWQTGIDLKHYLDYIKVQEESSVEVRILFLHSSPNPSSSDLAWGSPATCPTGLFGQSLRHLMKNEDHRDAYDGDNGRTYPMVYWNVDTLERLATLDEVQSTPVSLWREVS